MHELKPSMAGLFNVSLSEIDLAVIEGGLSHKSYCCRVSGIPYYIKEYNNINNISNVVNYINELTSYMCERGVPASRVILYSPKFPNIVVHEFVEGEIHDGEFSQVAAIAELYSKVAMVGKDHGRHLSKADYLSTIQAIRDGLQAPANADVKVDENIHNGMLVLTDTVLSALKTGMPDDALFHFFVHDDFTEKNILLDGDLVKLLCDWDSCRLRMCNEHIASTATRFSTERPLGGVLQQHKLGLFLRTLNPGLLEHIVNIEDFAVLFPYWATLNHLRTYLFRNSVVHQSRWDLKASLLEWPLQHCRWLIENRQRVSDWVSLALLAD